MAPSDSVFSIKGDARRDACGSRLRDDNPRCRKTAPNGGTRRSGHRPNGAGWRCPSIGFSHTRNPRTERDPRVVKNTRGIVFLAQTFGVAKPGTEGVIWVDDVAVY